jgi:hypothetical protein
MRVSPKLPLQPEHRLVRARRRTLTQPAFVSKSPVRSLVTVRLATRAAMR